MKSMTISELKKRIKGMPDDAELRFEDVCGNWTFEIYHICTGYEPVSKVYLVGDQINEG